MAYVYRHIRLDTNQVFYIGIGGKTDPNFNRAYKIINRNKFWTHITNKTPYEVEIMLDDLAWEEACSKEREFIKLYGRRDLGLGTLCNLTDGGEGADNRILTEEHKIKIGLGNKDKYYIKYNSPIILNTITGVYYESIAEAARSECLNEYNLWRWLTGQRRNKTNLIIV